MFQIIHYREGSVKRRLKRAPRAIADSLKGLHAKRANNARAAARAAGGGLGLDRKMKIVIAKVD